MIESSVEENRLLGTPLHEEDIQSADDPNSLSANHLDVTELDENGIRVDWNELDETNASNTYKGSSIAKEASRSSATFNLVNSVSRKNKIINQLEQCGRSILIQPSL